MSRGRKREPSGTLPRVRGVRPATPTEPLRLHLRLVYRESAPVGDEPRVDQVFELQPNRPLIVGRDLDGPAGQTIAIPSDGWLSRQHAQIALSGEAGEAGIRIRDLGSRNGTLVDGEPLVGPVVTRLNQVIQAGSSLFVVGRRPAEPVSNLPPGDFDCRSWGMQKLWRRLLILAASDDSVLLLGEIGTGKTRVARLIHELGQRDGPFVPHNCSAIPTHLEEATLFGVVGNFIPSVKAQPGLLTRARGGTLFLDELADMPPLAQAKLLDAFDPHTASYMPVGGTSRLATRCRLISATNRDVFELAEAGVLRHDLLSRLVVGQLTVPPLRERREDLLAIFGRALQTAGIGDPPERAIGSAEVAEALLLSRWVENVRGLETLARRVALGEALTPDLIRSHAHRGQRGLIDAAGRDTEPAPTPAAPWPPNAEELLTLLARHQWSVKAAAEAIGRRRETLSRHMSGLFGGGGKAPAQRAWRVWQASGRAPTGAAVDALHDLFCSQQPSERNRAAREAWIARGQVPQRLK